MTKKYTPKEAAIAILKKAEELYGASTLAKAETGQEKGVHTQNKTFAPNSGVSQAGGPQYRKQSYSADSKEAKMANDASKDKHKEVLGEMKAMPKPNIPEPMGKAEAPMKGHMKLARFVGRMDAKKEQKAKEIDKSQDVSTEPSGYQRSVGVSQVSGVHTGGSGSKAGGLARSGKSHIDHAKSGNASNSKVSAAVGKDSLNQSKDDHKQVLGQMKAMPKPKLPG